MYGAAGDGPLPSVPFTQLTRLKVVAGYSLLAQRAADPQGARADMTEAGAAMAAGRVRTALHATFRLTEAAEAHRVLESRANLGRVLVRP